jgi:hypothetical protein
VLRLLLIPFDFWTEESRVCLELGSFRLLWVVVCGTGTVPCVTAYKWAKVFHMHPQDVDKMDSQGVHSRAFTILKLPDGCPRKSSKG